MYHINSKYEVAVCRARTPDACGCKSFGHYNSSSEAVAGVEKVCAEELKTKLVSKGKLVVGEKRLAAKFGTDEELLGYVVSSDKNGAADFLKNNSNLSKDQLFNLYQQSDRDLTGACSAILRNSNFPYDRLSAETWGAVVGKSLSEKTLENLDYVSADHLLAAIQNISPPTYKFSNYGTGSSTFCAALGNQNCKLSKSECLAIVASAKTNTGINQDVMLLNIVNTERLSCEDLINLGYDSEKLAPIFRQTNNLEFARDFAKRDPDAVRQESKRLGGSERYATNMQAHNMSAAAQQAFLEHVATSEEAEQIYMYAKTDEITCAIEQKYPDRYIKERNIREATKKLPPETKSIYQHLIVEQSRIDTPLSLTARCYSSFAGKLDLEKMKTLGLTKEGLLAYIGESTFNAGFNIDWETGDFTANVDSSG